jgi:hypothetical protein
MARKLCQILLSEYQQITASGLSARCEKSTKIAKLRTAFIKNEKAQQVT